MFSSLLPLQRLFRVKLARLPYSDIEFEETGYETCQEIWKLFNKGFVNFCDSC